MKPGGEHVTFSRSEIRRLADALDPMVAKYRTRDDAARALGLGESQIGRIVRRPATAKIARVNLDKIGRVVGIDTSMMGN